jgi:sensor histidine kinase YesM
MENSYIKELLQSDNDMLITIDTNIEYTLKKREPVVSFIGKIFDADKFPKRKLVGVYIINIPYSRIENAIGQKEAIRGNILLLNKSDTVLYSSDIEQLGKRIEYREDSVRNSGKNDFFEIWEVGLSGLKVAYIFEEKALYAEIYKNMHKTYLILAVAIAITLIWSWCVCQVFNKRVRRLTESMSYVQKGDFSHRIPIKTQDEIGLLSEAFNDMCEKLNDYIVKVYHSEIKLKNAEVNALQTQINPHFLYNTLESIKAEALVNNDVTTAQMISQLGNLFRWSSKIDDKIVSLEDELDYINTYLELQQFRFHNNLKVDILVADDLLDYGVPKLILQPIIENTIKHGLSLGEQQGFIQITAEEKPGRTLEIMINDNGKGMTEEGLTKIHKKLKKEISQEAFGSIGMQNVHQRLRLMFGAEYGLSITSIEGQGTTVKLILPAMLKKEMEENV